jgi:hypothetical protein
MANSNWSGPINSENGFNVGSPELGNLKSVPYWSDSTGTALVPASGTGFGGIAGQVFVNGLTAGPSAAAANTAVLQALADYISTSGDTREVVFPDGDFYYVPPINFVAPPANEPFTSLSTVEARWPTFRSAGSTTFISQTFLSGGDWRFNGKTAAGQYTHLRFEGMRWAGPGVQVRDVRGLVNTIAPGATSIELPAGTVVEAGDAICISSDAAAGLVSPPPHWATVTGVTGTSPITVTFANQQTNSSFNATAGNIVTVFRNQCAVVVGGIDPARQDVFFNTTFKQCTWIDYFSAVRLNDCTTQIFDQCWWNFCMFGVEYGYNIDGTEFRSPYMMCQIPERSCTFTSGSTVVTMGSTASLRPGIGLNNSSSSAAATLPDHAVIRSVDSGTQVTMTHPSSATVTRSAMPTMGFLIAAGKSIASPWYPLQPAGVGGNGNRVNSDITTVNNVLMSHGRGLIIADGLTSGVFTVQNFYPESCQRVLVLGGQMGPSQPARHKFAGGKIEGVIFLSGPAFEIGAGNSTVLELSGIEVGGSSRVPAVRFANFMGPTLLWDNVNWSVTAPTRQIAAQFYFQGLSTLSQGRYALNFTVPNDTGLTLALGDRNGGINEEINQVDTITLRLTGNATLNNGPWGTAPQGKRHRIIAQQDGVGGRTLTLGSQWVNASGVAIGTIAAGTANQYLVLDFVWRGSVWLQVGGSTTWSA